MILLFRDIFFINFKRILFSLFIIVILCFHSLGPIDIELGQVFSC